MACAEHLVIRRHAGNGSTRSHQTWWRRRSCNASPSSATAQACTASPKASPATGSSPLRARSRTQQPPSLQPRRLVEIGGASHPGQPALHRPPGLEQATQGREQTTQGRDPHRCRRRRPRPRNPMCWNERSAWVWSNDQVHEPIISIDDFAGENTLSAHTRRPDAEHRLVSAFSRARRSPRSGPDTHSV